jgi:membrane-bound ClpP family serine protease
MGEVVEPLHPYGKVKVGTDEYAAQPIERMIDKGKNVVIEEIRGTSIYVRQKNGTDHTA